MIKRILSYFSWLLIALVIIDLIFFGGILFLITINGMLFPLALPVFFLSSLYLVAIKIKNYPVRINDSSIYLPQLKACLLVLVYILIYNSLLLISLAILIFILMIILYIYAIGLFFKAKRWWLSIISLFLLICAALMIPFFNLPGILIFNALANILYFIYLKIRHFRVKQLDLELAKNSQAIKKNHIKIISILNLLIAMVPLFLILITLVLTLIQSGINFKSGMQYTIMLSFFPSIFSCGPLILIMIICSFLMRNFPLISISLMAGLFWGWYGVLLYHYSFDLVLMNFQLGILVFIYIIYLATAIWTFHKTNQR